MKKYIGSSKILKIAFAIACGMFLFANTSEAQTDADLTSFADMRRSILDLVALNEAESARQQSFYDQAVAKKDKADMKKCRESLKNLADNKANLVASLATDPEKFKKKYIAAGHKVPKNADWDKIMTSYETKTH